MIVENIPNEDYHNKEKYPHLSSSNFKKIFDNPREFKESLTAESKSSVYMDEGSAFHDYNESVLKTGFEFEFLEKWGVFEHPRNPKTGQPVGITTKGYKEAQEAAKIGKEGAISEEQYKQLLNMQKSFERHPATKMVHKGDLFFERSFLVNDNGIDQKIRPDRESNRFIIDVKTCRKGESHIDNVSKLIQDRGYDISAAMYQHIYFIETGIWKPFVWMFAEKEYPYQVNYHFADAWAYKVRKLFNGGQEVEAKIGALRYKRAVEVYKKCAELNKWGGTEVFIDNKFRIGTPEPKYYSNLLDFTI